jgi:hypothetical protein
LGWPYAAVMVQVLTSLGIACLIGAVASAIVTQVRYSGWRSARLERGEKLLIQPFDMLQAFAGGDESRAVRRSAIAFNALAVVGVLFLTLRDSL